MRNGKSAVLSETTLRMLRAGGAAKSTRGACAPQISELQINTYLMSTKTAELNLETISYAKKAAIAYVTLNRPKVLNALSKRTWEDLKAVFEVLNSYAAVWGAILTGAGDKAFIAG